MINKIKFAAVIISIVTLGLASGCNNMNRSGSNETSDGTTTTNAVNSTMEDDRTGSDIDTLASPGSNAMDAPNNGNISNKGTGATTGNETAGQTSNTQTQGADNNMRGQSSTHGKDTKSGDN